MRMTYGIVRRSSVSFGALTIASLKSCGSVRNSAERAVRLPPNEGSRGRFHAGIRSEESRHTLLHVTRLQGVALVSVAESVDTSSAAGRLVINIRRRFLPVGAGANWNIVRMS